MQPVAHKQVQLLILFSFAMLIVLLSFVSTMAATTPGQLPPAVGYAAGAVAIIVAAAMTLIVLRPVSGLSPGKFQVEMLKCLAFSELGTLLGFVTHLMSGAPIWPLAAGSLAVDLLLILPRVFAFWRYQDSGGGGTRTL